MLFPFKKYKDLGFEVKTAILTFLIGALGTVPKRLIRSIDLLGIGDIITSTQMTALLGTAGITMQGYEL